MLAKERGYILISVIVIKHSIQQVKRGLNLNERVTSDVVE